MNNKKYAGKYRISSEAEPLKGYEVMHIINNIKSYEEQQKWKKIIPICYFIAFVIAALMIYFGGR